MHAIPKAATLIVATALLAATGSATFAQTQACSFTNPFGPQCSDLDPGDCAALGGIALGPGTSCPTSSGTLARRFTPPRRAAARLLTPATPRCAASRTWRESQPRQGRKTTVHGASRGCSRRIAPIAPVRGERNLVLPSAFQNRGRD